MNAARPFLCDSTAGSLHSCETAVQVAHYDCLGLWKSKWDGGKCSAHSPIVSAFLADCCHSISLHSSQRALLEGFVNYCVRLKMPCSLFECANVNRLAIASARQPTAAWRAHCANPVAPLRLSNVLRAVLLPPLQIHSTLTVATRHCQPVQSAKLQNTDACRMLVRFRFHNV